MLYKGRRNGSLTEVLAGSTILRNRSDVFHHANTREWGRLDNTSAQLALDILMHHTDNQTMAVTYHQAFKQEVVSQLPVEGWTLSDEEINDWLRAHVRKGEDT